MNNYLFYTTGGYTEAPDGTEVQNCQKLGCAKGETPTEAWQELLKRNSDIMKHGFIDEPVFCYEIGKRFNIRCKYEAVDDRAML